MPDNFPDATISQPRDLCRRSGAAGCILHAYSEETLDDRCVDAGHRGLCSEHIREMRELILLTLRRPSKHL